MSPRPAPQSYDLDNAALLARSLGRQFAADLNSHPHEAQNWRPLSGSSDIPDAEASALGNLLTDAYGQDYPTPYPRSAWDLVDRAYVCGFNETFDAALGRDETDD